MKPGPKVVPMKLRALHGNPSQRAMPTQSEQDRVELPAKIPAAPSWMPDAAKREWRRVARLLKLTQLVTSLDIAMLEMWCTAYATWRDAEEALKTAPRGWIVKGEARYHPMLRIAQEARHNLHRAASELGFSPAARASILLDRGKGGTDDDADPFGIL